MDDEPALSQLIEKYLTRLGYNVESHSTAQSAMRTFAEAPDTWQLVIADLNLPDLPGQELIVRMFELNPQLRCLLCSGAPFDVTSLPPAIRTQTAFLLKPFLPSMLSTAITGLIR